MKNLILVIFILLNTSSVEWNNDYEEVIKEAQSSDKNILIYFSGSDWCKPCIQMKNLILDTDEFKAYSENNFILYQADFPRLKKNKPSKSTEAQNEKLASKYNQRGVFPLIVILDKDENLLSTVEYQNQSKEEFISRLEQN